MSKQVFLVNADSVDDVIPGTTPPRSSVYDAASWVAKTTFSYVKPLLNLGNQRPLVLSDVPSLANHDIGDRTTGDLEREWERVLKERNRKPTRWSLWKAIFRAHRLPLILSAIYVLVENTTYLSNPILLRMFIRWLGDDDADYDEGIGLAVGIFMISFCQAVAHHLLYFQTMRMGWNCRMGFTGLIHKKLLRLSGAAVRKTSSGKVVNLVSTDVIRFDNFMTACQFTWTSPLCLIVATILICLEIGVVPGLSGVVVILFIIMIQVQFGRFFFRRRRATARFSDDRARTTSDVFSSMLSVKAFCWESSFVEKISGIRKSEAQSIFRSQTMKAVNAGMALSGPVLASMVTFSVVWARDDELELPSVLAVIALFNVLRRVIGTQFARAMEGGPECHAAVSRIQRFLMLEEVSSQPRISHSPEVPSSGITCQIVDASFAFTGDKAKAVITEPTAPTNGAQDDKEEAFEPSKRNVVLQNVNIKVAKGELVMVAGPVGAGKSSLLESLLGELFCVEGSVTINGTMAYAPQQSWIMAGSLKSNIVFGKEYDDEYYQAVLDACALKEDIEQLPNGEDTEIGEKGVNLSGGQKARVSLARAVYSRADLILLDDPLSAVDPHVANHLFEKAICGLLKSSAVILVTHHKHILKRSDKLVLLSKDGKVVSDTEEEASLLLAESVVDIELEEDETKDGDKNEPRMNSPQTTATSQLVKQTEVSPVVPAAGSEDDKTAVTALVLKEDRTMGMISVQTFIRYGKAAGTWLTAVVLALLIIGQGCLIMTDIWVKLWADKDFDDQRDSTNVYVYIALAVSTTLLGFLRALLFFLACIRAGSSLHNGALQSVLSAPMAFFTSNPHGRILNRFTADLGQVDELLSVSLFITLQYTALAAGSVIVVCVALPWMLISVPVMLFVLLRIRQFTTRSLRELKRMDGTSRSPVFAFFSATVEGLVSIRAYSRQDSSQYHFMKLLDRNAKCWFWWLIGNRWLGFRLDMLSTCFVGAIVAISVGLKDTVDPGLLGLALVYSIALSGMLQFTVRQSALVETYMTSVERILYYVNNIPSEEGRGDSKVLTAPTDDWPAVPGISFQDVSAKYREDLPIVLRNITIDIKPGHKVGVVGRTGSGKSSLIQTIYRLNEICGGKIFIDDVDTSTIPLHSLRSRISLIPQEPHLFIGTLRYNLDPFEQYTDAEIWDVLNQVQLGDQWASTGLGLKVEERGANFSAGERQMLSLARAMLRKTRIVVLDEATSNVDYETESKIQHTLQTAPCFRDATVLIIAHRIKTIADCDDIIVLDNGALLEYGTPAELMSNPDSAFADMVEKSNQQDNA